MVDFFKDIEEAPVLVKPKERSQEEKYKAVMQQSQEADRLQRKILREPSFIYAYIDLIFFLNSLDPNNVSFIPKAIERLIDEVDPMELIGGPLDKELIPCIASILLERLSPSNYSLGDKPEGEIVQDLCKMLQESRKATFKYNLQLPYNDLINALRDPTKEDTSIMEDLIRRLQNLTTNEKQAEDLIEALNYRRSPEMQKQIKEASKKRNQEAKRERELSKAKAEAWKRKEEAETKRK